MSLAEGRRRRDAGIAQVSTGFAWWVSQAKEKAVEYALKHGDVCSDDIHKIFPVPEEANPSIMGAVFRDPRFKRKAYTASTRPSAHGRIIRLYIVR